MDILDSIDQVKNLNKGKNKLHFDEIITKLKKDENITLESEKKKITNKFINKRKKIINNKLNEDENSYYDSKNEIYFLNKKIKKNIEYKEQNTNVHENIEKNNELFKQPIRKDRKKKFRIKSKI